MHGRVHVLRMLAKTRQHHAAFQDFDEGLEKELDALGRSSQRCLPHIGFNLGMYAARPSLKQGWHEEEAMTSWHLWLDGTAILTRLTRFPVPAQRSSRS